MLKIFNKTVGVLDHKPEALRLRHLASGHKWWLSPRNTVKSTTIGHALQPVLGDLVPRVADYYSKLFFGDGCSFHEAADTDEITCTSKDIVITIEGDKGTFALTGLPCSGAIELPFNFCDKLILFKRRQLEIRNKITYIINNRPRRFAQ